EREFSRSPSDTLRAYLCWFRVRAPTTLLEDFLGSVESENFGTKISLPITVQDEHLSGFSYSSSLTAWAHTSIRAHSLSYCVPPLLITVMRWYRNIKDRKSTRLNSSHVSISYAVFCLKKKT